MLYAQDKETRNADRWGTFAVCSVIKFFDDRIQDFVKKQEPIATVTEGTKDVGQWMFEEYMKQVKQEEKEWVRYYSRPMMALERAANFKAFFSIFLIFGIGSIGGSFYLMFYGLTNELERKYFA